MTDAHPTTGDIDLRLLAIDQNVRDAGNRFLRALEVLLYTLGGLGVAAGIVAWFWPGGLWNGVSLAGLGVTLLGAGIALSIFRVQADQTLRDNLRAQLLLSEVSSNAKQAATHSKTAADNSERANGLLTRLSRSAEVADAASEQVTRDIVTEKLESVAMDGEESESDDESAADTNDIVRVSGDGEYRYPAAVPLYVLADLVKWFPQSARSRWTISNLEGAYRKYNDKDQLTSAPWILTFKNTAGEIVEYRVSYAGRRKGPNISAYSSDRKVWQEFVSPGEAE